LEQNSLKAILNIDKKEFKITFDLHYKPLCAFGYRYVKDSFVAEDMIQEVFEILWEKRSDFNHEKAVKAFLYTSVRNKCLNHLKHKAVLEKHEEKLIYELESESFFTQHVIEEETFNQLYIEIEHLPNAAKKIILLALKGLKNKEIAETLNISENTVKTQKKIAYSKLKKGLSPIVNGILLSL
jgi:RNA polymerase sigma-70 factor (ECF subfamily)